MDVANYVCYTVVRFLFFGEFNEETDAFCEHDEPAGSFNRKEY